MLQIASHKQSGECMQKNWWISIQSINVISKQNEYGNSDET